MIINIVKLFVWVFVTSVWVVLGLYLWIPALVVAIVFYVFAVFVVAFYDDNKLRWLAEKFLNNVTRLYQDGFSSLYHSIWDEAPKDKPIGQVLFSIFKFVVFSMLTFAAATIFWFFIVNINSIARVIDRIFN